jgi:hypothetical protein
MRNDVTRVDASSSSTESGDEPEREYSSTNVLDQEERA